MPEQNSETPRLAELPRSSLCLVDDTLPPSWERLPEETSRAYNAFCLYRDLGATRTIHAAFQAFCAKAGRKREESGRINKNGFPSTWGTWASQNAWRERAESYDDFCDRVRLSKRTDIQDTLIEAFRLRTLSIGLAETATAARLLKLVNQRLDLYEQQDIKAQLQQQSREAVETKAHSEGKAPPDWRGQKCAGFVPIADYLRLSQILRNASLVAEIGQEAEAQSIGVSGLQNLLAEQQGKPERDSY